MSMILKPFPESYWVVPNALLAGEYPRSLDEEKSKEKIGRLIGAGVTAFIDLTEEGELEPYSDLIRPYAAAGVTHERFPICDVSLPASHAEASAILDAIDAHLANHQIVYVHCYGGIGRTGTIIGCWLSRHGEAGEAALLRLRELWKQCSKSSYRRSPETPEQEQYVRDWKETT